MAVLAVAVPAVQVDAWGNTGHRLIGVAAMRALPDDLPAFLKTPGAVADVGELAREPDRWKGAGQPHDRERDTAHFIDLDDQGRVYDQRGMSLTEAHVRLVDVDTSGMPVNVLEQVSQVLHAEVVRDVRPDTPLRSQDIRPTILVKRGQMVLMSIGQAQGFQISARVEAQQDGRYGEQIKLKNRDSGRMLTGLVKGPNQVQGL
jgi:flagella basal body P-ring formation protein FlgA